jgi:hypothetical protein
MLKCLSDRVALHCSDATFGSCSIITIRLSVDRDSCEEASRSTEGILDLPHKLMGYTAVVVSRLTLPDKVGKSARSKTEALLG